MESDFGDIALSGRYKSTQSMQIKPVNVAGHTKYKLINKPIIHIALSWLGSHQ